MQHTLQKLAGLAFRGVVRPWPSTPRNIIPRARPIIPPIRHQFQAISTALSSRNAPSPLSSDEANPEHRAESGPSSDIPLTLAAQGRAAAFAIRQLLHEKNVADAYVIINSIRYADLPKTADKFFGSFTSMKEFDSIALAFSPGVSPRLPCHTLLHGLLRLGMADKASKLASDMVSSGIRVQCRTIEAIYSGLIHASQTQSALKELPSREELESPGILHLDPSKALDKRTGFAIRLLGLVRQSRQRRSSRMFKLLITLCVINGEIILASLLFGVLIRDCQARHAQANEALETPKPTYAHVADICHLADDYLANPPTSYGAKLQYQAGLQALANLANFLDQQLIQMPNIARLLSSLCHCPRGPDEVWVTGVDGNIIRVQAYSYINGVLDKLIDSLSKVRKKYPIILDSDSCHSLLGYSLNNRYSIPLAAKVWRYMLLMRFTESNFTHAILDRAGEVLDLTQLRTLDNPITVNDLKQIKHTGDNYILDAYLRRLIAEGRHGTIIAALPSLLPGFDKITCRSLRLGFTRSPCHTSDYGPVVFGALLTCLVQAKQFKKAEKLFLWIRVAESHSWQPDENGVVTPWCIPIHIYTNMIHLYESMEVWEKKHGRRVKALQRLRHQSNVVEVDGTIFKMKNEPDRMTPSPRECAMDIYRMVKDAAPAIERKLSQLDQLGLQAKIEKRHLDIPRPDIPFFNAILKFARRPFKGKPQSVYYYHRQFRQTLDTYLATGRLRRAPLPVLLEIAQDLVEAGIPIPLLYRTCLIGRIPTEKFGNADDIWPGIVTIPYDKWRAKGKRNLRLQQHLATAEFSPANILTY
ncbi:hypothetical protein JR316_0005103 [Psilocybe cubensis]|uniref:Pentatricopeptide repeat-containing protein n=2 Tax=Psilocybe cubensis TaxID=181762 RepID=A0A8H7XXK2_PSICU|nr:hypothetical protein JR316_0005103 [Psilocybe cubensis]KAH9483003.1 hypothetical protein JR316_0005103 [Psilocybe cubensis]